MKKIRLLITLLLVSLCSIISFGNIASANTIQYTSFIKELKANKSFNIDDYPAVEDDYSINVVQIAETKENTLVVYVYQPSALKIPLDATLINMTINRDLTHDYRIYNLKLLEKVDVFAKYVVEDFVVDITQEERYYSISAIYRKYDDVLDKIKYEEQVNDDAWRYDHMYYTVAKSWYVTGNAAEQLNYQENTIDVVEIEIDFVGFVEFQGGWELYRDSDCYAHFVMFRCKNYDITKIIDGDIRFITKNEKRVVDYEGDTITSQEPVENYKTLYDTETASYTGNGLFARTYNWKRIQSVNEFKETASDNKITYTKSLLESIDDSAWVFFFTDTEYKWWYEEYSSDTITISRHNFEYTLVSEVSILRLHFLTLYGEYDLPAVSDIVSGDMIPDGTTPPPGLEFKVDLSWLYKLIEIISKIVIVLIVIAAITCIICLLNGVTSVASIISTIGKVLLAIIVIPFNFISSLFDKSKKKKKNRSR